MSSRDQGGWISIIGWSDFQHVDVKRSTGPPPWIKTYTRLMHDDEYLDLTEHCALLLHRVWLTYASSRCQLRATTSSLSRRLGLRVMSRDLEALVDAGFIAIVASKAQAEGAQPASGLARARGEEEEEEEVKPAEQGRSKGTGGVEVEEPETPSLSAPPGRLGDSDAEDKVIDGVDWSLGPVDVEQLVEEWTERA